MPRFYHVIIFIFFVILTTACTPQPEEIAVPTAAASDDFTFGLILVGPSNDHGWSEAHYNGGLYIEQNMPNSKMLLSENLNPNARPEATLQGEVKKMIDNGAQLIFITSDDFSAETLIVARKYSQIYFVHISGDHALQGASPVNLSNYMGKMIYGKMIAGCAAALATENNAIGYVGPLINSETLRLANASYLGAKYCFDNYRDTEAESLRFRVEWIGFWFHVPGVTADPTEITNSLLDDGFDVILSGIDTIEPSTTTAERAAQGENVYTVPYDYENACQSVNEICLGVPYYNWGPGYLQFAEAVSYHAWKHTWVWAEPDWADLNNPDTSPVGFATGAALTPEQQEQLDQFIAGLGNGSINLFRGPLNLQDGSIYLRAGETASDEQIWNMPQLLKGMEGLSE
ncbi:MAG: BMP family ABC transporter substrate-binding protein [Chloroflexi bacterium]|jgi:simple sugar transport system substrate-binding protein|nr:BMP family ABC transporter substrate-binding protein [Chloroflexota bacterium]